MANHYPALADKPRTLANVLLDIAEARKAFDASWYGPRESECLDRLDVLSDEARSMIEASTGVSWNQISEASL